MGKKPLPKKMPKKKPAAAEEDVPFSQSEVFRRANANRKTPGQSAPEGPPPVSDEMLSKIASDSAGEPPPFRGGSDPLEGISPEGAFPPGYEPPFQAPGRPGGGGGGGMVGMAALAEALRPTPTGGGAQDALIGKIGAQSSVLGGAPSNEEIQAMLAHIGKPPNAAPAPEMYSALQPDQQDGAPYMGGPSSGGSVLAASQSASSPKSGGAMIRPAKAPAQNEESLNPYLKGMAEDPNNLAGRLKLSPADQEMINRVMEDEVRKGFR